MQPVAPLIAVDKPSVGTGEKHFAHRLRIIVQERPVIQGDIPLRGKNYAPGDFLLDDLDDRPDLGLDEAVPLIPVKRPDAKEKRRDANH